LLISYTPKQNKKLKNNAKKNHLDACLSWPI
jgi:hypothetical protein